MPQFNTIVYTTELEAVNAMLRAVGESPIEDLDTVAAANTQVEIAVAVLRKEMRDSLLHGWRFNSIGEYRIANTTVDTEEGFTVPSDLLDFTVTDRSDQRGPIPQKDDDGTFQSYPTLLDIDVGSRTPTADTLRFVDRLTNSRVIAASDRPQIFIDAIFAKDFDECPEAFRNYITMRAARQFAQDTETDQTVDGFTAEDVGFAYKNLVRRQRPDRPRKMVSDARRFNFRGGRYR